ncbi:MAG: C1 family peptidase [Deltaproteobacteria bacterium]|nr:C1 family peptidase [Deltaproteobacteria bacterium]
MRDVTSTPPLVLVVAAALAAGCPAVRPLPVGVRTAGPQPVFVTRVGASESARAVPPVAPARFVAPAPEVRAVTSWTVDLRPYLLPPIDQSGRSTCNSFAATALMEFLVGRATGTTPDFSENWNYYVGRTETLDTPYLRNMYAGQDGLAGFLAVEAYERSGPVAEADWPYEARSPMQLGERGCRESDGAAIPDECFTGKPPGGVEPLGYRLRMEFVPRETIGSFLVAEQRPVVLNIYAYDVWDDSGAMVRMPTASEAAACADRGVGCTGHTVLLVGWDESTRTFLFRNSIGASWGDGGYGTLTERFVLEHCEACYWLEQLDRLDVEDRAFVEKAAQGVSGVLVEGS